MPMLKGSSPSTIKTNIKEFHTGPTYAHTLAKFGKKKANAQAIAAAYATARRYGRAEGGPAPDDDDSDLRPNQPIPRITVRPKPTTVQPQAIPEYSDEQLERLGQRADTGRPEPRWMAPPQSAYRQAARGIDTAEQPQNLPGNESFDDWLMARDDAPRLPRAPAEVDVHGFPIKPAQRFTDKMLGLHGQERIPSVLESGITEPIKQLYQTYQSGAPIFDPRTGEPTPGYSEGAFGTVANIAGGVRVGAAAIPELVPETAAGMFVGRLATSFDKRKLAQAKQMRAAGASEGDIWRTTGIAWDKYTGRPYKETPDNSAALIGSKLQESPIKQSEIMLPEGSSHRLGDVLSHPLLYKDYPWLKDVVVKGGSPFEQHSAGMSNLKDGIITMFPAEADDFKNVLLHEVQHFVQFRAGLSPGGNWMDFVTPQMQQRAKSLQKVNEEISRRLSADGISYNEAAIAIRRLQQATRENKLESLSARDREVLFSLRDSGLIDDVASLMNQALEYSKLKDEAIKNYNNTYGEAMARNTEYRSTRPSILNQTQTPNATLRNVGVAGEENTIPGLRSVEQPWAYAPKAYKKYHGIEPPEHLSATSAMAEKNRPTPNELGFYHKAEDIAMNGPAAATPREWAGIFKNRQLKADEDNWLGLSDWLNDQKGKLTKQEVLDHIRGNQIKLHETVATGGNGLKPLPEEWGGNPLTYQDQEWRLVNNGDPITLDQYERLSEIEVGRLTPEQRDNIHAQLNNLSEEAAEQRIEAHPDHYSYENLGHDGPEPPYGWDQVEPYSERDARWSDYQLPGGSNYKELKLKWANPPKSEMYQTPFEHDVHFPGEKNLIGHMRVQDRDIGGKKTLNLLEMQSDWHQEGSQTGYKTWKDIQKHASELEAQRDMLKQELKEATSGPMSEINPERANDILDEIRDVNIKIGKLDEARHAPPAPFKKTWDQMLFKRLLRYAAEHDYEQISWAGEPDVIKKIENWPDLRQENGRWVRGEWKNDLTPIVNRYLKDLPAYANKIGAGHGIKVENIVGSQSLANNYAFHVMKLSPEFKKFILSHGFEQFRRGGKVMRKRAPGGSTPFHERAYNEAIGAPAGIAEPGVRHFATPHTGMIHSAVPGRTDKLSMNVKGGSYIMPASVVSGIGQGNSQAGAAILNKFFKMSPYGASAGRAGTPKVNYGRAMNMRLPSIKPPKFAEGGAGRRYQGPSRAALQQMMAYNSDLNFQSSVGNRGINHKAFSDAISSMPQSSNIEDRRGEEGGHDEIGTMISHFDEKAGGGAAGHVPIVAAGGEFVIPPYVVKRLGGGSMKEGHRILDELVMHLRSKTIKDMQNEKPPKK